CENRRILLFGSRGRSRLPGGPTCRSETRGIACPAEGVRTYHPREPSRGDAQSDGLLPVRDRPLHPALPRGAAGCAPRLARDAPELPPPSRGLVPPPWDAREASVDRRPLLAGGEAVITPVTFSIDGTIVRADLAFTQIGAVPSSRNSALRLAGPLSS